MLLALLQVHFDSTISLGNLVSTVTFLFLAGIAWADLRWRVRNLEIWRGEHMVDAESRDKLVVSLGKIVDRLQWVEDARQKAADAPPGKQRFTDH